MIPLVNDRGANTVGAEPVRMANSTRLRADLPGDKFKTADLAGMLDAAIKRLATPISGSQARGTAPEA